MQYLETFLDNSSHNRVDVSAEKNHNVSQRVTLHWATVQKTSCDGWGFCEQQTQLCVVPC